MAPHVSLYDVGHSEIEKKIKLKKMIKPTPMEP